MRGYYRPYVGQEADVPNPNLAPQLAPPDPVGEAQKARWRRDSIQAVVNAHRQRRSPWYGYLRAGSHQKVDRFTSLEAAFAWFELVSDDRVRRQRLGELANYDYMAIFDANNLRQAAWHEYPHFWDQPWLAQTGVSGSMRGYGYPMIVGDEVDESMERLHADVMDFGQVLRDLLFVPGTWSLRPGVQDTDRYRFYYEPWAPLVRDWISFRSQKRDVPWQTLPGSGTAGAIYAFRERFVRALTQAVREGLVSGTGYTPPGWTGVRG